MNGHHEDRDIKDDPLPREPGIPLLHTAAEQAAIEQKRQEEAEKQAEAAYKGRQLAVAESANKLSQTNVHLTWVLAFFTGLTAAAAWYQGRIANKSADAATDSVAAFRDTQAAQLVFEDFTPTIASDLRNKDCVSIIGPITVTNVGQTVAREVFTHGGYSVWSGVSLPKGPRVDLVPAPIPNGEILQQGKSLEIPVGEGECQWGEIVARKWFFGFVAAVSYRDIFGRSWNIRECFTFNAKENRFLRGCPGIAKNFNFQAP